ncbi:MAG: methyltransferase domain-containing protein [Candidatus Moranbacteria bacterium]|nr:methyltransferase domain-containing protein [Candidatus Moranbacteria bacterium]
MKKTISELDKKHYELIRKNVSEFLFFCNKKYVETNPGTVLDIAPQDHEGAKSYFTASKVKILDIDPNSNADYIVDLCENNSKVIKNNIFDWIVCTEVIEHVKNPFKAVQEMHRILKKGGMIFATTPFNFRIHGPLPDCWRFTKYGLEELFKKFDKIIIEELETDDRWLMPIHYTIRVIK